MKTSAAGSCGACRTAAATAGLAKSCVRSLSGGLSTFQLELPALALDQGEPVAELTGTGR